MLAPSLTDQHAYEVLDCMQAGSTLQHPSRSGHEFMNSLIIGFGELIGINIHATFAVLEM
ncbi:hypothetical protein C8Q70DRAFT_1017672 [Cubamyces menziesii]|nr:hypothetical protein C8Q70DRAFT_1017672 [Cubamyces menziesii]